MCLYIQSETRPKFKIAKKDIPVYKIINKNGLGCYKNLYIDGRIEYWTPGFIYTETNFREYALSGYRLNGKYEVHGNALHSCKTMMDTQDHQGYDDVVIKMYIPKGAFYYENNQYYASSSLHYPKNSQII